MFLSSAHCALMTRFCAHILFFTRFYSNLCHPANDTFQPTCNTLTVFLPAFLLNAEMLTSNMPFSAPDLPRLVTRILAGSYNPISPKYSQGCRDLVRALLQKDPKKRPSVRYSFPSNRFSSISSHHPLLF